MLKSLTSHWPTAVGLLVVNIAAWGACRYFFLASSSATLWQDQLNLIGTLVLTDTLLVVWWYTDVTSRLAQQSAKQIEISEKQFAQAWLAERIRHKPFVVSSRVPLATGGYQYCAKNIGPGLAVSVWYVSLDSGGALVPVCLGALGSGESRSLPEPILRPLCDDLQPRPFILFGEALWTRTSQWLATANVRGEAPGSDIFSRFIEVEEAPTPRAIDVMLTIETSKIRSALGAAATTVGLPKPLQPTSGGQAGVE